MPKQLISPERIRKRLNSLTEYLTAEELDELDFYLNGTALWEPLPGPQEEAYFSEADITGYGGAAGGGKTDLACGLALTRHTHSIIYRREGTQLQGIYQRMEDIRGARLGFNEQTKIWRMPDIQKIIEFGGVPNLGDEKKYQGRPHDLKVFDETTEFLEIQVRFLMGWLRSVDPAIKQRILMTFNPPTTSEGQWVIEFFGPWLAENHPNPAEPGELRYFTTDPETGKDIEVDGPDPVEIGGDMVNPVSRTFIPARVEDNPYYMDTGYKKILQALPEPLRSQMLQGDFTAGLEDDQWQVIPSAWVDKAMGRWRPKTDKKGIMDSIGVDVARGGRDEMVISQRYGTWFDQLKTYPGTASPDGPVAAGLIIPCIRNQAPVHIDIIGWGASPYDFLKSNEVHVIGVNNARASGELTIDGLLGFANIRAQLYWQLREALDPINDTGIALPPDRKLKADLCAPTWKLTPRGILVESKEDIIKRLGRSTDRGDAVTLSNINTPKRALMRELQKESEGRQYNPRQRLERKYNPQNRLNKQR